MELDHETRGMATLLLALSSHLVAGIHAGTVAAGFDDLRPTHGFVFVRVAAGDATVGDIADHLGVTKQAASQLVDELVAKGYLFRRTHPHDARARLIELTERGWACTRAADAAAAATVGPWVAALGPDRFRALYADLARLAPTGPIRPGW